jgi:hypothetical protein
MTLTDGNTAGKQADDAVEQGEAEAAGERTEGAQEV